MGFFNPTNAGCDSSTISSLTHDESLCDGTESPTAGPSVSLAPSVSVAPSDMPSISNVPSVSLQPSDMPSIHTHELSSPLVANLGEQSLALEAVDGIMLEVYAKHQNIYIR